MATEYKLSYTAAEIDERLAKVDDIKQSDWNQNDETASDYVKNKPEIIADEEIIEMLAQEDMLPVVADADGSLLSDENNNVLLW